MFLLINCLVLTFRTPVMVVSAGVKSILDIGLTLEYLETMGVCVTTFGSQVNRNKWYGCIKKCQKSLFIFNSPEIGCWNQVHFLV